MPSPAPAPVPDPDPLAEPEPDDPLQDAVSGTVPKQAGAVLDEASDAQDELVSAPSEDDLPVNVTMMALEAGDPFIKTMPSGGSGESSFSEGTDFPILFVNTSASDSFLTDQLWNSAAMEDEDTQHGVIEGGVEETVDSSSSSCGAAQPDISAAQITAISTLVGLNQPQQTVGPVEWTTQSTQSTGHVNGRPAAPDESTAFIEAQAATNVQYLATVRDQIFTTWTGLWGFQDEWGYVIDRRKSG